MTLTTEEMGDMPAVDAATLEEVLSSDSFGKFAVLSKSSKSFIQAGSDWQPGPACEAFIDTHGSDPWVLEYRERGRQFRAVGLVTLDQVQAAFRSYLSGRADWRTGFTWGKIEV
ncbi:hypothetical protein [Limnoglobus roseus]|uniref:Uncharacterized protein n=1 Tax=Limnoglobus roseus TaxID=2598579 RepID=A0A5C1ABT3_9BACT|nr:hypothetical protein [Limnoglobus roseus]QEL15486.1 hypothetical protein PX52LOC_02409 [Limnoglobus roseus]